MFCPWSSLRMSACTVPRTLRSARSRISTASAGDGSRPSAANCWSMAVLRNIARTAGAGPLMVIDTEVLGSHRSNPE